MSNVSRCTDFALISTVYNINLSDPSLEFVQITPVPLKDPSSVNPMIAQNASLFHQATVKILSSSGSLSAWQPVAPHPATSPELGLHATISCQRLDLTRIEIWQA